VYLDKKADYPVKVTGIEILPNPVVSGAPATFKISATSGNNYIFISLFLLFYSFQTCINYIFTSIWIVNVV